MIIYFKKDSENNFTLHCVREDGTETWDTYKAGDFQIEHDIMHYSVETILGYKNAFYGTLKSGKDISWFATPDPALGGVKKPRLSLESATAEILAGQLQALRDDKEFLEFLPSVFEKFSLPVPSISIEQAQEIRKKTARLFSEWKASKDGISLEF